ncbi:hydroxymethylbilane synthase [Streptomyces albireticuli]|uniref:hydroxymethylbilane synthase n=1 Tax=Streptomyces albireticuli TaxID=1940 RepID=UPI001E4B0975|nr:hydroxymethylbilane synthase [Streptomyces albireticuli]MCD9145980.1 hydroxymethylbilane synthase [Streptomyces albireticuli]
MPRPLRIGAPSLPLALIQVAQVQAAVATHHPGIRTEHVPLATPAQHEHHDGTGLMAGTVTSDIEHALLAGECDAAVRCMKDVPGVPLTPTGTVFAAYLPRGDRRDALVNRSGLPLDRLPPGTQIATSSVRRTALLTRSHPQLKAVPIHGTIDARLAAVESGAADASIVAFNELKNLGQWHLLAEVLGVQRMCPPLGATVLGLQCRADDTKTISRLAPLDDPRTRREITAERILLRVLRGRCETPVAGHCTTRPDGRLSLRGTAFTPDGHRTLHCHQAGTDPATLGTHVAHELLSSGARDLADTYAL